MKKMSKIIANLLISMMIISFTGCVAKKQNFLSPGTPHGFVSISVNLDKAEKKSERYYYRIPVYQIVNGQSKKLGLLRNGGFEIGDYLRITATAVPGDADFFIEVGDKKVPFNVIVKENSTSFVKVFYKRYYAGQVSNDVINVGHNITFKIDTPVHNTQNNNKN